MHSALSSQLCDRSVIVMCILLMSLFSCGEKRETPPEVRESYQQLKSELDEDSLGESIKILEDFRSDHSAYTIFWIIDEDIARLRKTINGQLRMAREMARDGDLERAEIMIKDLAEHFPDTEDGEMAEKHLQFEFYRLKATRLMMDENFDEARQAINELMEKDLTAQQAYYAENLLDGISTAMHGRSKAEAQIVKAACHKLFMLLKMYEARHGYYPGSLTLASMSLGDHSDQKYIKSALSAIINYKVSEEDFSFTAVSKDGKTHILVTQDGL